APRQAVDPGPQHGGAALGVQGEVAQVPPTESPGGPTHRGGDVVQLEVEEDEEAEPGELVDGAGADGTEELQTHLGDGEPGLEAAGQSDGHVEIVDIEGQGE